MINQSDNKNKTKSWIYLKILILSGFTSLSSISSCESMAYIRSKFCLNYSKLAKEVLSIMIINYLKAIGSKSSSYWSKVLKVSLYFKRKSYRAYRISYSISLITSIGYLLTSCINTGLSLKTKLNFSGDYCEFIILFCELIKLLLFLVPLINFF